MKINTYLFIVLLILLTSSTSVWLLWFYMDPEKNMTVAMTAMAISALLMFTSLFGLFLFLFKKIYYRGEVYTYHIYSSLRQGFLAAVFTLCCIGFFDYGILNYSTLLLSGCLLIFLELMMDTLF